MAIRWLRYYRFHSISHTRYSYIIYALVVSSPSSEYYILFRMKKKKSHEVLYNYLLQSQWRTLFSSFFFSIPRTVLFYCYCSRRRPRTLLVSALIAMFGLSPPRLRDRTEDHVSIYAFYYIHIILLQTYNQPVPSCRFEVYIRRGRTAACCRRIRYACIQGDGFRQIGGVITGPDRRDTD